MKSMDSNRKLTSHSVYSTVYTTVKMRLATKGVRAEYVDPQERCGQDSLSMDEVVKLFRVMMSSDSRTSARDMAMALWCLCTVGRGDDSRLMYVPDLVQPALLRCIGPCPAFILSAVEQGGKTMANGQVAFRGCLRCVIGCLNVLSNTVSCVLAFIILPSSGGHILCRGSCCCCRNMHS